MSAPRDRPSSAGSTRRTRPGWPSGRPSRSSSPTCPSSTPTITCGSGRTIATCCTNSSPTSAPATTSSPRCSWNATRCTAPTGPEEMRPVGETEFVAGIAAMSDSGLYGPTRVAAGIVGFADLTLGDRVEPVLEAHDRGAGGGRFRGVRHSAAWDASDVIGNSRTAPGPHLLTQADFRAGLAPSDRARPVARRLGVSSAARRRRRPGARLPRGDHHHGPRGRAARLRPLCGQARRGVRGVEGRHDRAGRVPERDHEARRHDDAAGRVRLPDGSRRRRPRPSWPRSGVRTSRRASSCSGRTAACSRATSPSTRWGSAGRRCGTRSSGSRPAPPPTRSAPCSAARRGASTDSSDVDDGVAMAQSRAS